MCEETKNTLEEENDLMSSYQATPPYRSRRNDSGSGAFFKVLALMLGIAVGVLSIAAVALVKTADDARDEAKAAAVTTDHSAHASAESSAVSLPLESFAGKTGEDAEALAKAHAATDATLPPVPPGDLVKVQMTLKDMVVEIAPGVKYNTWAFDGHGAPGPIINVREGQTVEMKLTNGGSIPHSIDFHAARIAPDKAFRDAKPGESLTFRFTAGDPGVYMYHCGTKPVLAHIANGMYGAIIVQPKEGAAEGRQRVRPRRQRVVPERRRGRRAGLARHGEGASEAVRLGDVQRIREPVRHASVDGEAGRDDALLGRRRGPDEQRQLPRRRHDLRPRVGELRPHESSRSRASRRSSSRPAAVRSST